MSFRTIENFRLVDWEKLDNLPNNTNLELSNKVDNVIAWQNTTVSRNGNVITVNSLWWPAVITDWFNRNYFTATEWQTEFTATFDFTENTWSVIVTLNWIIFGRRNLNDFTAKRKQKTEIFSYKVWRVCFQTKRRLFLRRMWFVYFRWELSG